MQFEVSPEIIKKTTKCIYDFKCLEEGECPACKFIRPLIHNLCLIETNPTNGCPYHHRAGLNLHGCTCPVRNEIARKYKQ